eukprot:3755165-Pleurochrysis_carterae.AAC.1
MSTLRGVVSDEVDPLWGRHVDVDPLARPFPRWCMTIRFGSAQMMSTLRGCSDDVDPLWGRSDE